MQTNKHELDASLRRFMPEGCGLVRGLGVPSRSDLFSFPQPARLYAITARHRNMTDNSGSSESCTNWVSRFVSSTNMGNEAFLEPQDSSAPASGQIIRRGIVFQQTLMSIFLFAQSRQLVAIRDMLVGECVWLRRWHMTSQSWHTGRWRDSTSSIRFQKEKWIKKTILKARRCLYEWSLM